MQSHESHIFGPLLVLLVYHLVCPLGQIVSSEELSNTTNVSCINGHLEEGTCVCLPGWTGAVCDTCMNNRLRLTEESGLIFDGSENYVPSTECLFYLEANSSVRGIHLRVRSFHTECQWDALHVFTGDSLFHPKIAAYTGDIVELPLEDPTVLTDNATTLPPSMEPVPIQYQDLRDIRLSSSGSQMLLYFYTDKNAEQPGFNITYWLDYGCPDNCSGQGVCDQGVCRCDAGWTGTFCHLPLCPNNCSGNGLCDLSTESCNCSLNYTGIDCSISTLDTHWERLSTASLSHTLTPSTLARASHSTVVWGDHMLIYGGYQFPIADLYYQNKAPPTNETRAEPLEQVSVLRYHFATKSWDELETFASMERNVPVYNSTNDSMEDNQPRVPMARYGHSAIVYNNTMYIFGGALIQTEQITAELWALDLTNMSWRLVLPNEPSPSLNVIDNATDTEGRMEPLPLAVRSHTSHLVDNKILTLFGLSSGRQLFLSSLQEYNLDTGVWSLPRVGGVSMFGRMGHTSVYDSVSGLIFVHGGIRAIRTTLEPFSQVLSLDTSTYSWSTLTSSGPIRYLHSSVLIGPLLVTFGGCEAHNTNCFKDDTHIYNTLCDSWTELSVAGLPSNGSRYGHGSVLDGDDGSLLVFGGYLGTFHHDLLKLQVGDCRQFVTEGECVNGSGLCAWSEAGVCVRVGNNSAGGNLTYQCQIDSCLSVRDCQVCNDMDNCLWSNNHCQTQTATLNAMPPQCPSSDNSCSVYESCSECWNYGCFWGALNGSTGCYSTSEALTVMTCPTNSCFSHSSCDTCTATATTDCLWCPSLSQCVLNYPLTYIYSQCLGWVSNPQQCPLDCGELKNCTECQDDPRCGWCNDPSDTGLGRCLEGGFSGPRQNGTCDGVGLFPGEREAWNFDTCPSCQCNGHSVCVNASTCEECQNKTTGGNCEICQPGYFGDARNGGNCTECDCNGYNTVCNDRDGTCSCLSFYVGGPTCRRCTDRNPGDADNFCYNSLRPGFIYTFNVDEDREVEAFFVITPSDDIDLHFRFEAVSTIQPVVLQLFLGKLSEDLWLLSNLTDPIQLDNGEQFDRTWGSFESNSNVTIAQLFSFTRPSIRDTSNFTKLLAESTENDYSSSLWDSDVSLVVYVSNLTNPGSFKVTVDQQDLLYLLYFFATFAICFSVLLLMFLTGWYIKRKIQYRAYVRAQYIELRRRVARPFARIKTVIEAVPPPMPESPVRPQQPSYVGVETCHSGKAAVLSLLVRLPGNHETGRPCPGRSGLAFGSTMVGINSNSKKTSDKSKKSERSGSEERSRRRSRSTGRVRLRDVSSSLTTTNT